VKYKEHVLLYQYASPKNDKALLCGGWNVTCQAIYRRFMWMRLLSSTLNILAINISLPQLLSGQILLAKAFQTENGYSTCNMELQQ